MTNNHWQSWWSAIPSSNNNSISNISITSTGSGGGSAWSGGAGGYITTNATTYNTPVSAALTITGDKILFQPENNKNAVIVTNKNSIDIDWLYETVKLLAERLAVLAVDPEILKKYPTLLDAYEQYQILNAMIQPKKED
jgi:hypothetical protein